MRPASTVELRSDWACAGGRALGDLTVLEGREGPEADGLDRFEATCLPDSRTTPALRQVVRVTDPLGAVREYRLQSIGRQDRDGRVPLRGLGPLADLGTTGLVRTIAGGLTTYAITDRRTPADHIATYVLANLAADGLSWLSAGTITPTGLVSLSAPVAGWTRLQWLRQLADETGAAVRLRRNGETGYLIDLAPLATGVTKVVVQAGWNLRRWQDTVDDGELASAVTVVGGVPAGDTRPTGIGENAWTIGTVPGSAPYWIPLADPAGGAGPVAFDNQFGTGAGSQAAYLLLSDATTVEILDSRASDSAVLVAAATGLTAGHHAQVVADASATRLTELRTPHAARLHREDVVEDANAGRNLLRNGLFLDWSSVSAPQLWTAQGGTFNVGEYPRTEPATLSSIVVNGNQSSGAPGISLRGFTPGGRVYANEYFVVGANAYRVGNVVAVADGAGVVSVVLASGTLAASVTDGQAVTWFGQEPKRPASVPTERDTNALLRLLTVSPTTLPPSATALRLQSEAFRVKYLAPLARLACSVAFTVHNGSASDIGNTDSGLAITDTLASATARELPGVMLRNNAAGTRLAWTALAARVPAGTTRHETVTCETTLTADTTVDVCLLGGTTNLFQAARWVTLWLGPATSLAPYPGSWDNLRWQRANRALLARSLGARQLECSFVQLAALTGGALAREALTLGDGVRIPALGVTLPIVRLRYAVENPSDILVTLDTASPRLTALLAERL